MKSKNILTVINNFKKIVHLAPTKENLNMNEYTVSKKSCGTVCCHGGWYTVTIQGIDSKEYMGFTEGASNMALDLGYENKYCLQQWAYKNPELWGNKNALGIFCDKEAFIHPVKRPNGAETLQDIIDHWTEVYERIRATEAPEYKDITSELAILPVNESSDVVKIKELV